MDDDFKSAFAIAYMLCAVSGFLMGVLVTLLLS